jgi:cation diffusion facilitator CzcD-associated flavoprotein CzcO
MDEATYGVKENNHIPGAVLHRYLTDFAKKFGVFERTRFHTRVVELSESGQKGWALKVITSNNESTLTTEKIILATGLTSTPNIPQYPGLEHFTNPVFHAKDFCKNGDTVHTAKRVTVVGGAKSAYDVSWAYANSGAEVDLVIRPTGNGPVWLCPPWVMGGAKKLEKLLHTRWMTWFSPCPWGGEDGFSWVRGFLHGTAVGRFIVRQFWGGLADDVIKLNNYDAHEETKKLRPWNEPFWIGSGLSIHNYDSNFWDMVKKGQIKVHIADIDHLSGGPDTVHLDNGESFPADILITATGWKKEPSVQFKLGPNGIGLPYSAAAQKQLATDADEEILKRFPRLADQPSLPFKPKSDPFRLYRFMVPPTRINDRNIAFAGLVSSVSTSICALAQGLWISAYLDGKLDRRAGSEDEVTQEVMVHTQWGRWRHPTGYGASLPDFVFDAIPVSFLSVFE